MLACANCALGEYDVDPGCPAYVAFSAAKRDAGPRLDWIGAYRTLGLRHLQHRAPVVRILAAHLATADLDQTGPALLAQLQRDAEPKVAVALLQLLDRPDAPWRPALQSWARQALAGSVEQNVKVTAMAVLDLPADVTVLLARLADPQEVVQATACQALYKVMPATIAASEGVPLRRRDAPELVTAACLEGAAWAWCADKDPDHAAQSALLREFAATPRTQQRPPWRAIAALHCPERAVKSPMPPLLVALRAVVDDRNVGGFARAEAVRTLVVLGAPAAWRAQWRKSYANAEFGADGMVKRALAAIEKR